VILGQLGARTSSTFCRNYYSFTTLGIFSQGKSLTQNRFCVSHIIQTKENTLWCREGELNPQGTKYRRILSPLRLPVPPSRPDQLCGGALGALCAVPVSHSH
jgi:hypothetical protein